MASAQSQFGSFPRRSKWAWLAAALACVLAGCNTLYLHNPEREALTDKAKQQLSGVNLVSMIDQQTSSLEEYAGREDAAVVEYGRKARDQRLLSMFRPDLAAMSPQEALDAYVSEGDALKIKQEWARRELTASTDRRLRALICAQTDTTIDCPELPAVLAFAAPTNPKASQNETLLNGLKAARNDYASALTLAGRESDAAAVKHCSDVSDEEVADWLLQHPNTDLQALASEGKMLEVAEVAYYTSCSGYKKILATDRKMFTDALKGGAFKTALEDLAAQKDVINKVKAQEGELNAAMQELADAIGAAQTDKIGAAANKVAGVLEKVGEGAKGLGLERLSDIVDALIQDEATSAADDAAGTGSGQPDDARLASLSALSKVLKNSAAAAATIAGENPIERLNSLLILRAGLQQKIDETRLYRGLLESQLRIAEAKVSAMEAEVYQLARAKAILERVPEGSALANDDTLKQALSAYTVSWDRGRIPQYLASFKEAQVRRVYSVKLYEATAKNYQALLEPAFAALEAYAKGGITPGDLAKVLAVTLFLAKFATL